MATTARQPKPRGKGMADPPRRPAWQTGARPNSTLSPTNNSARLPPSANQGGFPPLGAQTNGSPHSRPRPGPSSSYSFWSYRGTTITLTTKTAQRYEGVISSTASEGDTAGVTLKDVKEISKPGAPLKESFFIPSTNIDTWQSGPADAKIPVPNGDSFRTDADISKNKSVRERELQAWQPTTTAAASSPHPVVAHHEGLGDEVTFGPGSGANVSWDQFAANEQMFGVTTTFDEEVYTTKLDRTAADYKERERKAQRIASEILNGAINNPHVAEERNLNVDDSGVNEEDKYGAVVRGQNAYVPPGARKMQTTGPISGTSPPLKDVPKVSVNGPDGGPVAAKDVAPPAVKSPSPTPSTSSASNKPPADPLPAFRDFVTNERQRLTQKKQALVKSEMDKRKAELLKFSQTFKLNKPIPDDLVPILAKDEEKQRQIREKASVDAASTTARAIGVTAALNASPSVSRMPTSTSNKIVPATAKPTPAPPAIQKAPPSELGKKNSVNMYIQPIPPFKGAKRSTTPLPGPATHTNGAAVPTSPTTTANRLNANASSFRPNLKGPTSPIPSSTSASASPKAKPAESSPSTPNPFFGTKIMKKGAVHIKDDFNPFKHNKVVEANQITAIWPYSGKRYMHMFPPLQHQSPQQPVHIAPPGPPPVSHPVYEDSGEQRVYYYPYYPGQPMMPGMAPPPPGAYVSSPFMQPMAYPPGMPPNGQPMYAASPMPQMPPPQYMQPPPGTYPPPPNGAGPRPSMPPTPIPSHAHAYYHQSPQLQHAVPYPMMMPPAGPNGPPHPYEAGPAPPQMGGVGHA
ncbi:hypothetical protein EDD22DRAFT_857547 [Suillus occidentalis]|nr:hypothetical protein EDD22DRAFT_857547 [Suillus occidentalis]